MDQLSHRIESRIYFLRGCKVMLSADLAALYEVEVRSLIQAVKRNSDRFPDDFMFQLSLPEFQSLKSQIVISKGRGGLRRARPYAFTEQGVAMLSGILHSPRAVRVNIEIMRTFVRLKRFLASHEELARHVQELERRYDGRFKVVFEALRNLAIGETRRTGRIGFRSDRAEGSG